MLQERQSRNRIGAVAKILEEFGTQLRAQKSIILVMITSFSTVMISLSNSQHGVMVYKHIYAED